MRFLTAVEFVGQFLTVRVASVARGGKGYLVLKVTPQRGPDVDDASHAEWDSKRRIPVPIGWDAGVSPWRACRYSGPAKGQALSSADADRVVRALYANTAATPVKVADLVETHCDASLVNANSRAALRAFLDADFDGLTVTEVLHGEGPDETADLTLAAAQNIHRALTAGEQLTDRQKEQAVVLLEHAPWQFGYWGAVKALLKAVPVDELADAYGSAVARLSSVHPDLYESESDDIENLDLLRHLVGRPRKKTLDYLARRSRRDLAALAKRSPETYAQVAARMLMVWDERLSGGAYAPAYVLLGAAKALDAYGRYVRVPADMASRRDPHPEIWNERPELVRRIFASVRSSVETLTWAYQVLESVSDGPDLRTGSINMALETTYPPLRRAACRVLPQHANLFGSLSTPQWISFFQNAVDTEVTQVATALTAEPRAKVGEALAQILAQPAGVSDRRARLAVLYLAGPRTAESQRFRADAQALTAAVERFELEYRSLWAPIAARMTPQELIEVYRTLVEHDASGVSLETIADEVIKKNWLTPSLAFDCVGSDEPKVAELGWRLVEANGGNSFFFERALKYAPGLGVTSSSAALRIVSAALPRATTVPEVVQLATWALTTGIDRPELAVALTGTPEGRGALWEMSADDSNADASALAVASAEVLRAVGDAVVPEQLSAGQPAQLTLILRYISENPARLRHDGSFGLAALESDDLDLQSEALRQLATAEYLPQVWLSLAESGVPGSLDVARDHTATLRDVKSVRDAVLACLNSERRAVQDMGIQLFRSQQSLAADKDVWSVLAQSNGHGAQDLVAEAALAGNLVDDEVLREFDRRILTAGRPSRRAKTLVKQRLETDDRATTPVPEERIEGLLTMTRSGVAQDREWSLMRLAALALRGVPIGGFEFSLTTTGTVVAGDVS